jgi:protein SCO1
MRQGGYREHPSAPCHVGGSHGGTDATKAVDGHRAFAAAILSAQGRLDAQSYRRGADYLPNLPVVTQDGKTLKFHDDVIKDKIVLISFIYTNRPDICPLTTARITQVEDKLGEMVGRDIFFISMTVDPRVGTPERLEEFAAAFGAGPGWLFLTGKPEDIRRINASLGDKSRNLSEHRNEIVLGNDATGEWARNSVSATSTASSWTFDPWIRNGATRCICRHSMRRATPVTRSTCSRGRPCKKLCAPCHTIGAGDRVGPDLRGATERRQPAWLTRFIRTPEKVLAEKDPVAVSLAAKFPGVRMPNLGLSEIDAADLIAYIETQTSRLADGTQDATVGGAGHQHQHH